MQTSSKLIQHSSGPSAYLGTVARLEALDCVGEICGGILHVEERPNILLQLLSCKKWRNRLLQLLIPICQDLVAKALELGLNCVEGCLAPF